MALDSIAAVVGISTTFINFVAGVRSFLRDYTVLNRLTDGVESSDRAIAHAALMMLYNFAETSPPLGFFTLETLIETHYMYTSCLKGTAYYVLDSVLCLMLRNEVPFNDGGLTLDTPSLIAGVERQAMKLRQEWEEIKTTKKIQLNIEGMQGVSSPGSEYALLHAWVGESQL